MEASPANSTPQNSPPRQHVVLVSSRESWVEDFAQESARISDALGGVLASIHHIGSTAIPGIRAKPIIDMLAVGDDLTELDAVADRMEALGYEVMGEFGISGRRYFRKDNEHGVRTHQVHAFQSGSSQIERHLAFRDYLRVHPERASEYDALKARLAAQFPEDISRYTDGKDDFINDIDARAAAWRSAAS